MFHFKLVALIVVTLTLYAPSDSLTVEVTRKDEVLVGAEPVIKKNVQSVLQCVHLCQRHLPCLCKSINILPNLYSRTLQCQILNFTMAYTNTTFVNEPNGKHIQVKNKIKIIHYEPKASCLEWKNDGCNVNGVYPILVNGTAVNLSCDMQTDGGGWTVIQNRFDGSVDFNKPWEDYKKGFGYLHGEFWLGNEIVHQLSQGNSRKKELWINGMWFNGNTKYRKYENFSVASEKEFYRISKMTIVGGIVPTGYSLMDEMKFTTKDKDNDNNPSRNCANHHSGGWWFNRCFEINLNGLYGENINYKKGIIWLSVSAEKIKESRMMIR